MKKLIAGLASVALLAAASFTVPVFTSPAKAQVSGTYTCEAISPYATGYGISVSRNAACNRALAECAVRTPYGYYCNVNRWWYNY